MKKPIIINKSNFKTKDLKEIVIGLLQGHEFPVFYLICQSPKHDGVTLTNLDKPTIIITVHDLGQFAKTFVHELIHLQQHSKGYANEKEAYKRKIVVTE